jgi:hypothetical protein
MHGCRSNSLPLTPDTLRAAYNYLNETPPFCRWNLPEGDDVEFRVIRSKSDAGWHMIVDSKDIIAVSSATIGRTQSLMEVMAHEMVHLHQRRIGTETAGTMHNRAFYLLSAQVCRFHGFDPKLF